MSRWRFCIRLESFFSSYLTLHDYFLTRSLFLLEFLTTKTKELTVPRMTWYFCLFMMAIKNVRNVALFFSYVTHSRSVAWWSICELQSCHRANQRWLKDSCRKRPSCLSYSWKGWKKLYEVCLCHELQYRELKRVDPDSQENRAAANATVATFHAKLSDIVVRVVRGNNAPV